jgi:hypothetical protein
MTENNQNPAQLVSDADHVVSIPGTDDFTMTEAGLEWLLFRLYTKDAGKPVPVKPSTILTGSRLESLGITAMEAWELPGERVLLARCAVSLSGRVEIRVAVIDESSQWRWRCAWTRWAGQPRRAPRRPRWKPLTDRRRRR